MTKRNVNRMSKGRFDMIWTTAESATVSENTHYMLMPYYIVRLEVDPGFALGKFVKSQHLTKKYCSP